MAGQLFIVATPIGNLGDITYRAVETLKQVDLIAAEDTRISCRLLAHYGIDTPMISHHEHNEEAASKKILAKINAGTNIALISDAGTPLISDPGYRLVRLLRENDIEVVPIPGPSSPIAALSVSGLPTNSFTFLGFLPRSGQARQNILQQIAQAACTQVLLESPKRLPKTLEDMEKTCGPDREVCMARELTKLHEEVVQGGLRKVRAHIDTGRLRGEIVLIVSPAPARDITDEEIIDCLRRTDSPELPPSARAKKVAKQLGITRSRAYELLLGMDR